MRRIALIALSLVAMASPAWATYSANVLADSPAYFWRLNETSGTTAADSAGTNTGTYQNGPTLNQLGALPTGDFSVLFASASSEFVSTATGLTNPGSTGYSLEAWFNTSTTATAQGLIELSSVSPPTSGSSKDRVLWVGNDNHVYFGQNPGTVVAVSSPSTYTDGNWHYAVGTWDATNIRLYIDGSLVAGPTAAAAPSSFTGNWNIGVVATNGPAIWPAIPSSAVVYFNGNLQDVAVYNTALSAARVLVHYQSAVSRGAYIRRWGLRGYY